MNQPLHDPSNHFSGVLCLPDMSDTCRFRYFLVECVHHLQASQANWRKICLYEWIFTINREEVGVQYTKCVPVKQHSTKIDGWIFSQREKCAQGWQVVFVRCQMHLNNCVHFHVLLSFLPAVEDLSNDLRFKAKCWGNCRLNFIQICFYS